MKLFDSAKIQLYKKALDINVRQHEAIAKNVANANDINYKRVKTDFSDQLHTAVTGKLKRTDPRHLDIDGSVDRSPANEQEKERVDINKEMADLAVNQIRFEFTSNVLKKSYKSLNESITGKTQ